MRLAARLVHKIRGAVCPHCWHPDERGWSCCNCPRHVGKSHPCPVSGPVVCQQPQLSDSLGDWLQSAARPAGRYAGIGGAARLRLRAR